MINACCPKGRIRCIFPMLLKTWPNSKLFVCANVGVHQGVLFLIDPSVPLGIQQILLLVLLNNNYYYSCASSFGLNVGALQLMFFLDFKGIWLSVVWTSCCSSTSVPLDDLVAFLLLYFNWHDPFDVLVTLLLLLLN